MTDQHGEPVEIVAVGPAHAPAAATSGTRLLLTLGLLTTLMNFLDRSVLNILAEPIKRDLHLTDTELGLLTGFAFALFYSLMGIPIARHVDRPRAHRPTIVAICMALWSAMTVASGLVTSYAQLLAARVLVAVGEAGSGPALTTLMDDCVPRARRTRAFSIYALGIPFGTLLGLVLGGTLVDRVGWRLTFVIVGAPGLLLALVIRLVLHEPRLALRPSPTPSPAPSLADNIRVIARSRGLRWLTAAASLQGLFGVGLASWNGVYLIRVLKLTPTHAGLILGLTAGIAGGLGTYFGGAIADRISIKHAGRALLVPTCGLLLGIPAALIALLSSDWRIFAGFYWIAALGAATYIGPLLSLLQLNVPPLHRATTIVIVLMLLNLVGGGLGALLIGVLSDFLKPNLGADSLRYAMVAAQLTAFLPAYFYFRASRVSMDRAPSVASEAEPVTPVP